eukprot:TRINITY_DN502_c0_g1_i1.p1 TRINITY_DN502_c0_g1~~TRINITY_DN502_c0_g1_i1.p1  ORF type:complete len:647 (+),score=212.14 TRINITY_DN502_c0_g1_i1:146-2086(+)
MASVDRREQFHSPSPVRRRWEQGEDVMRSGEKVPASARQEGRSPIDARRNLQYSNPMYQSDIFFHNEAKPVQHAVQRTPEKVVARTSYEASFGRRTAQKVRHDQGEAGLATPGRGSQVPATPDRELHHQYSSVPVPRTPPRGDYTPGREERTPREARTPNREERTPLREERTPQREERTPQREERTPQREERTPVREERTPVRGERTPVREDRTLREERVYREERTQQRDERLHREAQLREDRTPGRGDRTPQRGTRQGPPEVIQASSGQRNDQPFRSTKGLQVDTQAGMKTPPAGQAPEVRANGRNSEVESQGSGHTNSTDHQNLVCTNCINDEIVDDKRLMRERDREVDEALRQHARRALEEERARELEFRRTRAEIARENATFNRDISENKRRQQLEAKKNEKPLVPLFEEELGESHQRMLREWKKDVREGLLSQMKEKRERSANERAQEPHLTTLPIFDKEDPRRAPLMRNVREGLKTQIEEKERQRRAEQELDREHAERVKQETARYEQEQREAKRAAEVLRREQLRREMREAIEERTSRKDVGKEEDAAFKTAMDRAAIQDRERKMREHAERKERERAMYEENQKLVSYNAKKRHEAKREDKEFSASLKMVCPHRNKLYACCICNQLYPRNHLSKRYYNN